MGGAYLLILVLLFAPLVHGGNRPLPLLFLELLSVALLGFVMHSPGGLRHLPRSVLGLLLVALIFPLLQLIPLPLAWWRTLPGHEWYAQSLMAVGGPLAESARSATLVPSLTEFSWLALLPPLAVFLATVSLPRERQKTLVSVFLGLAAFQAILGLMQYGDGPQSLLRFGNLETGASASGTYANRDHLAGLLEMALPLALAMLAATLGKSQAARRHARSLLQRLSVMADHWLNQTVVYAAVAIALLLGLIFSQSRTGVVMGMLGILLSAIAFAFRLGGRNVYGMIGTFAAISIALAVEIGLVPVLDRFVQQDPLKDSRWNIYSTVLTAIGEFFPLGSGIGTFNQVLPRFQGADLNGMFINRAHNDYLEWVMEGGLVAAVLILGLVVAYLRRWFQVWKRGEWQSFTFVQTGAGIGLFAMMVHTFLDFNLHIPANQIYFAFLAGLFFAHSSAGYSSAPLRSPTMGKERPATKPVAHASDMQRPIQPGPNPFAE